MIVAFHIAVIVAGVSAMVTAFFTGEWRWLGVSVLAYLITTQAQ